MSASWDPEREGSFLGADEFSKNLGNIKDGLTRSRENAVLRERMLEYTPEEIDNVDAPKPSKPASLAEKMGDEFEN